MYRLRSASTARLVAAAIGVILAGIAVAAIALAAGGASAPAPKPLAQAVRDALSAPAAPGVSARITFTNRLIDASALQGSDPVLSGATGRLWATRDHLRLELQSDSGDAQIVSDGHTVTVSDASMHIAYRITLPAERHASEPAPAVPSLAAIQAKLDRLAQHLNLSGAQPGVVADRPAYTLRATPKRPGGLVGAAELAWDAARGAPLRAALYARGSATPVLELTADHVSFGAVPDSVFAITPPADSKVTTIDLARHAHGARPAAEAHSRPKLTTHGTGLGTIAVLAQPADAAPAPAAKPRKLREGQSGVELPTTTINGVSAQVLETPLGTILRFTRTGTTYTVAGSAPRSAVEAVARGL